MYVFFLCRFNIIYVCGSVSHMAFLLALASGLTLQHDLQSAGLSCQRTWIQTPADSKQKMSPLHVLCCQRDRCLYFVLYSILFICVSVHQDYKDDTLALWRSHGVDAVICPGFAFPAIPHNSFGELVGKDIFVLQSKIHQPPLTKGPITRPDS